jgi:predicted metal-dependent HD superfamily phosphohydrolase
VTYTLLEATFKSLVNQYAESPKLVEDLWLEVVENYSDRNRHYHNLDHLTQLLQQLLPFKTKVDNWDAILFATYYHDIIYNVLRNDNEENSAAYASERLTILKAPAQQIELCSQHILATKSHSSSDSSDTNLFTDADLSILGSDWESYDNYCQQIRKEYAIYPDLLYKPGRKKVLRHFLAMNGIFKTEPFHNQFEEQARQNITTELRRLV